MPLISLFAAGLLVLAGCGDEAGTDTSAGGSSDNAGQAATPPTAAEGSSGGAAAGGTGGEGAAEPGADSQHGDEEGARTPVEITIGAGVFTSSTPPRVHVPSFIAIELDVVVKDARDYTIVVVRDGRRGEHKVAAAGRTSVMLEGLRPNRSLTVELGNDAIEVIADAEPGP